MKNHKLQNTLKALIIYPIILLLALPIVWILNDMSFKESYKDVFKGFWRTY